MQISIHRDEERQDRECLEFVLAYWQGKLLKEFAFTFAILGLIFCFLLSFLFLIINSPKIDD
jgi:hypothetical protein